MRTFSPDLGVLPEAQRRLWQELRAVPVEFTLYGGTAIALQLGHRASVYFDFFGCGPVDVISLERGLPFLARAQAVQREKGRLTAVVDRGAPVKVSFVTVSRLPRFAPPLVAEDNGLQVASLLDLAGTHGVPDSLSARQAAGRRRGGSRLSRAIYDREDRLPERRFRAAARL
jgi:hypothetical protein